ncbi:hypothetical protein SLEP1_g55330, partial [Rubroshorea leprosula]
LMPLLGKRLAQIGVEAAEKALARVSGEVGLGFAEERILVVFLMS